MVKTILLYISILLLCFLLGVIVALTKCEHWCYVFLLAFPISFGWVPLSSLTKHMKENVDKVSWIIIPAFFLLFGLLVYGVKHVSLPSFWGITYVSGLFAASLITVVIEIRLRALLSEKVD